MTPREGQRAQAEEAAMIPFHHVLLLRRGLRGRVALPVLLIYLSGLLFLLWMSLARSCQDYRVWQRDYQAACNKTPPWLPTGECP
jgi:hypothetical protein